MFDNTNDYLADVRFTPYPSSYTVMECGLLALAEQEKEWGKIVQESTLDQLLEVSLDNVKEKFNKIYDKVVDYLKKAWEKIMKVFNQFITKLNNWLDANRKWAKKNAAKIKTGYHNIQVKKAEDKYFLAKSIKLPGKSINDTKLDRDVSGVAMKIAKDALAAATAAAGTIDGMADKYEAMSDERDTVSNKVRGSILYGKEDGPEVEASDYKDAFRKECGFDEKAENVYLDKYFGGPDSAIEVVSTANKTKQEIKKEYADTKKAINGIISDINKTKRDIVKLPEKDEDGDKRRKVINYSAKTCKVVANTLMVDRSCVLEAHKLVVAAAKSFCTRCLMGANVQIDKADANMNTTKGTTDLNADDAAYESAKLESVMGLW